MKKIIVTGANGFVGKNLLKNINKNEFKVFKVDSQIGDLTNPDTWKNFNSCEYMVHLAAKTFVPYSWEDPYKYIRNNVLATTNALDFCRKNNTKLILLSSYMYGNPKVLPTPETQKLSVNNPYGLSKLISEQLSNFYYESFNTDSIILRVFNLFGPYQPKNFLISQIISQIQNDKKISVSNLNTKRDYLYIEDLCNAIIKSLNYTGTHRVFNIGMGISYSVEEIIQIIQKLLNSDVIVENKNVPRKKEILETIADINLAKKELQWIPKYNFEEGLEALIKNLI